MRAADAKAARDALAARRSLELAAGRRPRHRGRGFSGALTLLLVAALLVAMGAGASAYRSIHAAGSASTELRLSTAFVANVVRAADRDDAFVQGAGPEGPSLVMARHLDTGDYETRLYLSGGELKYETALAGTAYHPDEAISVVPTSTFSFERRGDLLVVSTDGGTCEVALRSGAVRGGGAS